MPKLILLSVFLLASCGYTSRSTLHSGKDWNAFKNNSSPLPSVTLKVNERKLAYKNRVGFPPMFGGYIPSLIAGDPEVVKVGQIPLSRGTDIYLTGIKTGTTRIYQANGMTIPRHQRESISPDSYLYTVTVIE